MHMGGSKFMKWLSQFTRLATVFSPVFIFLCFYLAQKQVLITPHIIDELGVAALIYWWALISIIQFLAPPKLKSDIRLRLITYHLLAGSFLVFFSGVASPLALLWLVLVYVSYLNFGVLGYIYSLASLGITIVLDIYIWGNWSGSYALPGLMTFICVAATALLMLNVLDAQKTTRKELAESRIAESLQRDSMLTIVNNLTDAVISTDMDGIIKVYNAASLSLLDTNVTLKGMQIDKVLQLFDSDNKPFNITKAMQEAKTVTKREDLCFVISDDDKMLLEVTYAPIRSGFSRSKKAETHDGYVIIARDITKQKSLEEERDEFISVVSHELRTPIAIAEGTISNAEVMMGHPDVTDTMLKDSLKTAHDQIVFLAGMVNDLSTLSRAERGVADNTEEIDVRELAHAMHTKYAADAKARKLHLNLDLSVKLDNVSASRLYLEELLQNLITNALKYTKKGSVTIGMHQIKDEINFYIKDTGIGVSKSDQTKLFNKFFRSEDYRTRETSGTGLGLYIAAKLAH
ncbi:cell wall metabolism sensor histidine kinase WalK, partial [Candidatus Saccharibacteria bacterium]|nr:cell wall metabolism sensor histidine kinase WalK [Candidatus Saccharibacteria bacterium]